MEKYDCMNCPLTFPSFCGIINNAEDLSCFNLSTHISPPEQLISSARIGINWWADLFGVGGMTRQKLCGVYEIVNRINGHKYIGSSNDLIFRKWKHFSNARNNKHENQHFQRAWNKYGEASFEFNILLYCEQFERKRYEDYFIFLLDVDKRYNILAEAFTFIGYNHTEDSKLKIGLASSQRPRRQWTEDEKAQQSLTMKNRTWKPDDKCKQKISMANKGKKRTPDSCKRISKAKIGNEYGAEIKEGTLIDPLGNRYTNIFNLTKFCKERELHASCIFRLYQHKSYTYKGWYVE